jgi:TonB family protein
MTSELMGADLSSRIVVHANHATYHNMLRYAPEPELPRAAFVQCPAGNGLFVIDINYGSGFADGVRVVRSTGCPVIDKAVVSTLRQWRFMPHVIWKATIPVNFDTRAR